MSTNSDDIGTILDNDDLNISPTSITDATETKKNQLLKQSQIEKNVMETDVESNINENVKYKHEKGNSGPLVKKLFNRFKVKRKPFRSLANKKNYFFGHKNLFSKRNSAQLFSNKNKYVKNIQYNRYIWGQHSTDEHYEEESKNVQLVFIFNKELY